ncbi:MAG: hypothetical protein O3A51_06490 [Verrucomicrobia bacterium]|nr:hypothetical protein [Verrucomicrobiota bacterium]
MATFGMVLPFACVEWLTLVTPHQFTPKTLLTVKSKSRACAGLGIEVLIISVKPHPGALTDGALQKKHYRRFADMGIVETDTGGRYETMAWDDDCVAEQLRGIGCCGGDIRMAAGWLRAIHRGAASSNLVDEP